MKRRRSMRRVDCCRTCRRTTSARRRLVDATDPSDRMDVALDTIVPDDPRVPYDMHDVLRHIVDDGAFFEIQPAWAANIIIGFARLGGTSVGIVGAAAGGPGRRPRHRCVRQGRAIRPDVRCVQRAAGHVRRRAGIPAGRRTGAWRHHPPRREAAVRVCRGDRPEVDRHHAQGVWRRLRRHEQQAHPRRHEPRVADGRDRGDGRRGRGQHHRQGRDRVGRRSGRGTRAPGRRVRGRVREPVHRRRARLRRRRHQAIRDATSIDRARSRCSPTSATRTHGRSMATSRSEARPSLRKDGRST